ncbi:MAG: hypothetical protein ACUVT7_00260 [Thermoplasmata archaeon]
MGSSPLSESASRRNVNYLAGLDLIISLGFGLIMPLFPLYSTSFPTSEEIRSSSS